MLVGALSFAALGAAAAVPALEQRSSGTLSSWLSSESGVALQGILNNIGTAGVLVPSAQGGIIVASPSTTNPNYFYTWTRDAALTAKTLVDQYISYGSSSLATQVQNYISAQANIQTISNPSGSLCSGGLGEPKFYVNETAFTGPWGRPQRDGPALRTTALVGYARSLLANGQKSLVESIIWPIVQNDLSYVTQYWNDTTFDLWEEIDSSSFWTTASQYRALIEGNWLAGQIGQSCSNCVSQAPLIACFLSSYWNGQYAIANTGGGRSGKDANTILTSIHMFDPTAQCTASTWQPCSDKALANHKVVTDSFRSIFSINSGIPEGTGVAVGRYPEDVYMGGNPWYLSTFAAAEQLYDAVYQWQQQKSISITSISLAFFKDVYPSAAVGTYSSSTSTYSSIISAVLAYADSYMSVAQQYTPSNGTLTEQFSKSNGVPLSAIDLTWSYAAFLTAYQARAQKMPASWSTTTAKTPTTCASGSATGPCATATNTVWPCASAPTQIAVTFNELDQTNYGENIFLTGNITQLSDWSTTNAIPLSASQYTSSDNLWFVVVNLPTGTSFQYKFFKQEQDGSITWEDDPNREYTVPPNCSGEVTINDSWQ